MLHNKGEMQAKIMLNDRLQKVTPRRTAWQASRDDTSTVKGSLSFSEKKQPATDCYSQPVPRVVPKLRILTLSKLRETESLLLPFKLLNGDLEPTTKFHSS